MKRGFRVFILSVFTIFLLSSLCFASFIRETSLELNANENNTIDVKMTIDYESLSTNDISFIINGKVYNVEGSDENGKMNCTVREKSYGAQIICKRKKNIQFNYSVIILYKMNNIIFEERKMNKTIDTFLFEYNLVEPTDKLNVLFILPAGYGLVNEIPLQAYYPPNASICVINGRRVGIKWTEQNLSIGKSYFFKTTYEKILKPIIKNDESSKYYKIISLIIIGLLCIIVLIIFFKNKKKEKQKNTISDEENEIREKNKEEEKEEEKKEENERKNIEDVMLFSLLKEDEKKVFDLICASSGGISKQRQIARTTRFSPAKTSHLIKNLNARGLITITREGRTTRIELTEKAKEFLKK